MMKNERDEIFDEISTQFQVAKNFQIKLFSWTKEFESLKETRNVFHNIYTDTYLNDVNDIP